MQLSAISVPKGWRLLNNPNGTGAASGEWTMGGGTRSLRFCVAFSDVESFCQQVAGVPTIYGAGGGASIVNQSPLVYPFNPKLYAQRITMAAASTNPLDPSGINLVNPFTWAVVTVEFATFPYQPGDGSTPWLKVDVKGSTEFLTLPGVAFSFAGTGEKVEQDVGRIIGLQTYQITRYQIPSIDQWLAVANSCLGCTNSDTVTLGKTTVAPGYLLFPTQDVTAQTNALGNPMCEGSLSLVYRTVQWNQAMRSDGVFDTLTPAPYPTAALSALLN